MPTPLSRTAEGGFDHSEDWELGPAAGIVNGCAIGLGCWAFLLWFVFG